MIASEVSLTQHQRQNTQGGTAFPVRPSPSGISWRPLRLNASPVAYKIDFALYNSCVGAGAVGALPVYNAAPGRRTVCGVITLKSMPKDRKPRSKKFGRGYAQGSRRSSGPHSRNRLFRSERRAVVALHSAAHQEPNQGGGPRAELQAQLLCAESSQKAHLHHRRDHGRNRRRVRLDGHQRRRAILAVEEFLFPDGGTSPRSLSCSTDMRKFCWSAVWRDSSRSTCNCAKHRRSRPSRSPGTGTFLVSPTSCSIITTRRMWRCSISSIWDTSGLLS